MIGLTNRIYHEHTIVTSGQTFVYYCLVVNNIPIYEGKAYKIPNTNVAIIDVTDLLRDSIQLTQINSTNLFNTISPTKVSTSTKLYKIGVKESLGGVYTDTTSTDYVHYSYDNDMLTTNYSTAQFLQRKTSYNVIDGASVHNDYLTYGTATSSTPTESIYYYRNGANITITGLSASGYGIGHYHTTKDLQDTTGTTTMRFNNVSGSTGGVTYTIVPNCNRAGQLYWSNRKGGTETIPVTRKVKRSETSNKTKMRSNSSVYSSTSYQPMDHFFENRIYSNEITTSYQLYTDWITESDAEWLEELYASPNVWFHDAKTKKNHAVLVSDDQYDMKTRVNNDMKNIYYQINIEMSKLNIIR